MFFIFVIAIRHVSLRILETWIVPVVDAVTNGGGSGISSGASVLRVARVMRVLRTARMARLVRLMPELMILIKGLRELWKTRELMMTFKVIWWLKCAYMYTLYTQYRVSNMFVLVSFSLNSGRVTATWLAYVSCGWPTASQTVCWKSKVSVPHWTAAASNMEHHNHTGSFTVCRNDGSLPFRVSCLRRAEDGWSEGGQ